MAKKTSKGKLTVDLSQVQK